MWKWLAGLAVILALIVAAFLLSPWPGVMLIRAIFDRGAAEASDRLAPRVPAEVATTTLAYDPADPDATLDIHRPPQTLPGAPVIVWIHGGGFVSGRRGDLTNYLKVLSGEGFTVVNVDYTIAPEAHYPTPIRQTAAALDYLHREAGPLGIEGAGLVLAGDSAGAQIAAQTGALATNPDYAATLGIPAGAWRDDLRGVLLYCGVYDITGMGQGGGLLGWFVHVTGWAYSGTRNWRASETFATINFTPHLTASFPPAFVSAGNADPLGPQSVALARSLAAAGVQVETLFFPADYAPGLAHEYQFDLTTEAGQMAFDRMLAWLRALPAP